MATLTRKKGLVTVVIPCFNHAHFLPSAIESVRLQTYALWQVLVVDDGSTDNTAEVCRLFPEVKYVYQPNHGLSASRNTGIKESAGEFIVFLDADDILYPEAMATNVAILQGDNICAFVSGSHDKRLVGQNSTEDKTRVIESDHYRNLLEGNYIAMIAAVMFRASVLENFLFDTTLKACEDYDIYLRISREYSSIHHQAKMALYNIYQDNMSGNIPLMLRSARQVLKKQKPNLQNELEWKSYNKGLQVWKRYFCKELLKKEESFGNKLNKQEKLMLYECSKRKFLKHLFT